MNKRIMLLALAAVSASMLAMPTFASAKPAHLDIKPGSLIVHGGASALSRVGGGGSNGETTTGSGVFETTTTGHLTLTFHKVNSPALGDCSSTPTHTHTGGPGTVTTTTLPFHLITLPTESPAILITPATGHFATYTCGPFNIPIVVSGNGIIGTITSPKCNVASNTANVSFTASSEGVQAHQTYTGTKYTLESSVAGGSKVQSAMNASATITFGGGATPKLLCTHTTT